MGITKDKLSRFARAAAVSGLLGVGGIMLTAHPAFAGGAGSDTGSDTGTDSGSDTGSDDGGTTDGSTTDGGDDLGTTDTSDVGADDSGLTTGTMPLTGSDSTMPLVLGGTAIAVVVAGRKLLAKV